jgi:hypothetical protein
MKPVQPTLQSTLCEQLNNRVALLVRDIMAIQYKGDIKYKYLTNSAVFIARRLQIIYDLVNQLAACYRAVEKRARGNLSNSEYNAYKEAVKRLSGINGKKLKEFFNVYDLERLELHDIKKQVKDKGITPKSLKIKLDKLKTKHKRKRSCRKRGKKKIPKNYVPEREKEWQVKTNVGNGLLLS